MSSKFGYVEIVRDLVGAGAKLDLKNKVGETALDLAANQEIEEVLKDAQRKLDTAKHQGGHLFPTKRWLAKWQNDC